MKCISNSHQKNAPYDSTANYCSPICVYLNYGKGCGVTALWDLKISDTYICKIILKLISASTERAETKV